MKLRPYQAVGVKLIDRYIQRSGGALLADEMGLGKTAQALCWLRKRKASGTPALIVCPANAKYVWERECEAWLGIKTMILEGNMKRGFVCPLHGKIIVVNYDILGSWLPALKRYKFQSLIMDESHYISNQSTIRYKSISALAIRHRKVGRKQFKSPIIPYRLAISGTPLTNKPSDLWATLSVLWPSRYVSPWSFYMNYCRPYRFRGRWIIAGAKNMKGLHAELKENGMIRRFKTDVLKDLPDKVRNIVPVIIPKMKEYDYAEQNFIEWLKEINPRKAARAKRAETMTRIGYLLRLSARYKMGIIANWIDEFLDSGKKLIVFSYCSPLLRVLEKRYGNMAVRIDGSVRGRERMALVDRFQTDKTCRLAFCNGKAAGVALTLTAAWDILGTDFPWAPGTLMQAEDRAHRFGQKNKVTVTYLVAKDTMEQNVMDTLISKQTIIEKILNGKANRDSRELNNLNKEMMKVLISKALHTK